MGFEIADRIPNDCLESFFMICWGIWGLEMANCGMQFVILRMWLLLAASKYKCDSLEWGYQNILFECDSLQIVDSLKGRSISLDIL